MNRLLPIFLSLLATGCSIVHGPHGVHQFWGDYTKVDFADTPQGVHLKCDTMNHSHAVRAHYHGLVLLGGEAVSSATPGVGVGTRAAAAAVPPIVSGFTQPPQPPRATPVPVKP